MLSFCNDERKLDRSIIPPYTNIMAETTKSKDMVDLESIIRNWAKQIFDVTKTRDEAKINKKHLEQNVIGSQEKNKPNTGYNYLKKL
ncbi:Tryptophanase [Dirofilaria immitis]